MTQIEINPEARELVATVLVEAPAPAVWDAWITPDKIRRWWPFEGMTMTVCDNDVRIGGAYRFVGRAPDGRDHEFDGEYRELVENERIVHTETYAPFPGIAALVTLTLNERDGNTELVSRIEFPTDESFQGALGSGMAEGMKESLDRLAEIAASREISITRLVDAPRERIFEAWTNPELLKRWWAPRPFTTPSYEVDLRVGGVSRATMRSPEGAEFTYEGVYLEVVPHARLVFTDAFGPGWQPKPDPFMVGILTLEDEGGMTRYTATARHWSVEARMRHEAMGFVKGWNQCLDQLLELVAETAAV